MADTLVTGLKTFGSQTSSALIANVKADENLSIRPPVITFSNTSIRIDWSDLGVINFQAKITSFGENNPITSVTYNFTNALVTSTSRTDLTSLVPDEYQSLVTITYTPTTGEYPIFE